MIEGKDKAETIRLTAEFLGISLMESEFIYMLETGSSDGDVIVMIDNPKKGKSDGNRNRKKESPG